MSKQHKYSTPMRLSPRFFAASYPRPAFALGVQVLRFFVFFALFGFAGVLCAQTGGVIQGRVFNSVTKSYVRNAEVRVDGTNLVTYTEDGGFYRFVGVPVGEARVTVNYTGSQPVSSRVTVGIEPVVA